MVSLAPSDTSRAGTLGPSSTTSTTEPAPDFRIDGRAVHGVPGRVNLLGSESPGLTASLAIAGHVAGLLDG
jgi:L-2-hydroxyglutarate oxidase LhgO